jgi:DNA invertase Pin-like site-specific DNA recombinase
MSGTDTEARAGARRGGRADGGRLIGYARATGDNAAAAGEDRGVLESAGCSAVFADDREAGRPRLRECLAALRPGDILVVTDLGQLGRAQRDVISTVAQVRERGAGLRSLREDLDTTAPAGEAIFRVFAGLADVGRAAISAGTSDGLAAARARGKRLGRPPALTPEQLREVRDLLLTQENTVSGVARRLGVSRSTIYKYLPDVMHPGTASQPAGDLDGSAHGQPGRTAAAHLAPYQARPGRRALVIDDLADLRGPVSGSVKLPLRLFWSLPDHQFDLDDPDMRRWYYQTVLREATRADDLTTYLDGATLTRLWPGLFLPKGVRRAWEERHQSLRATVGRLPGRCRPAGNPAQQPDHAVSDERVVVRLSQVAGGRLPATLEHMSGKTAVSGAGAEPRPGVRNGARPRG